MADVHSYDLIVIGSGTPAAMSRRSARLTRAETACAEGACTLGGTCLNVGCIPSKALLHATELYAEAKSGSLANSGSNSAVALNLEQMHAEKSKAVGE